MFNAFKKILTQEKLTDGDVSKVNTFVLLRWLSGDPRLMPLANSLNTSGGTTGFNIETRALCEAISKALKGKVRFIKYPSARKDDTSKPQIIEKISSYFEVSPTEAQEYYDWCKMHCPDELTQLKRIYKMEE